MVVRLQGTDESNPMTPQRQLELESPEPSAPEVSTRTNPFPNVGPLEMVGPLGGRRFMVNFNDTTLRGMAKGAAGEPSHVVDLAKEILRERQNGGGAS